MSAPPKLVRVFYRSCEQRMKIYDHTLEEDVIKSIKKIFHIQEATEKIFLQDGDGDILVFPPIIPNGLCVHVYVEPEFEEVQPKSPIIHDTISKQQNLLPGFKWIPWGSIQHCDPPAISSDGYTLGQVNSSTLPSQPNHQWGIAVSNTVYDSGKLFFKMNICYNVYQSIGVIKSTFKCDKVLLTTNDDKVNGAIFCPYSKLSCSNYSVTMDSIYQLGIYIDFNKRNIKIFFYKGEQKNLIFNEKIPSGPLRIYGYVKSFGKFHVLERGSSPIPPDIA